MAAVMAIIIDNLQLKYRKVCAGRNLWCRSFSFSTWNFPIIVQQKSIFKNLKKSNMATVITIIIDNLKLKYRKVCLNRRLPQYMLLRYFCKTILTGLPDSFYDLKWPIYSSFLIGECSFSNISSRTSGIFNFFKHMS